MMHAHIQLLCMVIDTIAITIAMDTSHLGLSIWKMRWEFNGNPANAFMIAQEGQILADVRSSYVYKSNVKRSDTRGDCAIRGFAKRLTGMQTGFLLLQIENRCNKMVPASAVHVYHVPCAFILPQLTLFSCRATKGTRSQEPLHPATAGECHGFRGKDITTLLCQGTPQRCCGIATALKAISTSSLRKSTIPEASAREPL